MPLKLVIVPMFLVALGHIQYILVTLILVFLDDAWIPDVSIWLNQAMYGMQGYQATRANAHLVVLFNRICKLLHYKIKPIFVFDGVAPELKKHTLVSSHGLCIYVQILLFQSSTSVKRCHINMFYIQCILILR